MSEVKFEFDDHTIIIADIQECEDFFDYEYQGHPGRETVVTCECADISIITWIGDIQFDVTESIEKNDPKCFKYFKEWAIRQYEETYL